MSAYDDLILAGSPYAYLPLQVDGDDLSGNAHHGTVTSVIFDGTPLHGQATGSGLWAVGGANVSVPVTGISHTNYTMSIEWWMQAGAGLGSDPDAADFPNAWESPNAGAAIDWTRSPPQLFVTGFGSGNDFGVDNYLGDLSASHHYAFTFNGPAHQLRGFIDGVEYTETVNDYLFWPNFFAADPSNFFHTNMLLGGSSSWTFGGRLSHWALYLNILTPEQIAARAAAGPVGEGEGDVLPPNPTPPDVAADRNRRTAFLPF